MIGWEARSKALLRSMLRAASCDLVLKLLNAA